MNDLTIWSKYRFWYYDLQVADTGENAEIVILYLSIPGEARRRHSRANLLLCT